MKKNQNKRIFSSIKNEINSSYTRLLKRFFEVKNNFNFDIYHYLKAENEKLQIIYANIRV
jgi:hypothetical protein